MRLTLDEADIYAAVVASLQRQGLQVPADGTYKVLLDEVHGVVIEIHGVTAAPVPVVAAVTRLEVRETRGHAEPRERQALDPGEAPPEDVGPSFEELQRMNEGLSEPRTYVPARERHKAMRQSDRLEDLVPDPTDMRSEI